MTVTEAKIRILDIKKRLLCICLNQKKVDTNKAIRELHREYCKLVVQIRKEIPEYNNGRWPYINNCYFYALDIPTPFIFNLMFGLLEKMLFYTNIGEISGLPHISCTGKLSKNTILDYFYSDLDALKYFSFDSSINLPPQHGGYKIAIFYDPYSLLPDYHFIRQNADGMWSQKIGYEKFICLSENPLDFINSNVREYSEIKDRNFEYIKTVEVVKPTIQRIR